MDKPFTNDQLRIAARQAITLALAMGDVPAREDLLARAERLFKEARAAEGQLHRDGPHT